MKTYGRYLRSAAVLFLGLLTVLIPQAVFANPIVVRIDHGFIVHLKRQADSVVIGNPAIADTTVLDSHTLYVVGKTQGKTNIAVLDIWGHVVFQNNISVQQPNEGHLSVWRGAQHVNMACQPNCQALVQQ